MKVKAIKGRYKIIINYFSAKNRQVAFTTTLRTTPITMDRAKEIAKEEAKIMKRVSSLYNNYCFFIERI